MRAVADMLKAIHAAEDRQASMDKAEAVIEKLTAMRLKEAAQRVQDGIAETLTYYGFPAPHWRRIRTNNPLERIMREMRRRTRVVGAFPDSHSALMLAAARLRYIAGTQWGRKRYLKMESLKGLDAIETHVA
jgi:transposase-like protein